MNMLRLNHGSLLRAGVALSLAAGGLALAPAAWADQGRDRLSSSPMGERSWNRPEGGRFDLNLWMRDRRPAIPAVTQPPAQVWVEPVYQTVSENVWVDPVYRNVTERVWRPAVVEHRTDRVFVPGHYEQRPGNRRGDRPVSIFIRDHYEDRTTEHVLPAHFEEVSRQELVAPGHYEIRQHQVLVSPGHWEIASVPVAVAPPPRDDGRLHLDLRIPLKW